MGWGNRLFKHYATTSYPIGLLCLNWSTLRWLMMIRSEDLTTTYVLLYFLVLSSREPGQCWWLSEISSDSQWRPVAGATLAVWTWATLRNHQLLLCIVHGSVCNNSPTYTGTHGAQLEDFSPSALLQIKQSELANKHKQHIQVSLTDLLEGGRGGVHTWRHLVTHILLHQQKTSRRLMIL